MKSTLLVACLMLAAGPTAFASQSDSAATAPSVTNGTPAPVDEAKPGKKKVCTRERPMGSNMVQRVCRTVDFNNAEGEAARQAMRDLRRSGPAQVKSY